MKLYNPTRGTPLRAPRHFTLLALAVLALAFLLKCSKDPTSPDDTPPPAQLERLLQGVTFEPNSGPPGTPVTLVGLDSLPVDTGFTLLIGSQQAPLIVASGQPIRTAIPLNLDSTGALNRGAAPAKTVYLLYNGLVNDSVPDGITIDSLPPAPGAVDSVLTKLSAGSQALKQIALALQSPDTLLLATCDAMDELLYNGEYSLTALLDGTAPVSGYDSSVAGLFGSLLKTTGTLDIVSRWSDTLQVAARIARRMSANPQNTAALSDQMLADRMQLHDYLEGFGNQVIGQTALSWTYVSSIIGAVSIAAPVVGVYEFIVGFVLGELDFIVNKIAVAMLPSDVTRLDLEFLDRQVPVGDTTAAYVYISAKNNPPNITPADIISQVLAGLSLTDWIGQRLTPAMLQQVSGIVSRVVNWALGTITGILSANYNSPTRLDVALPHATWDSIYVHTPGCIDLISPDLSKMRYLNGSYNGRAGDSIGPVGLQMRTQPGGTSVYRNSILNSVGYAGGAFGDGVFTSNVDTVTVVADVGLDVDFANTMTPGGANQLGIVAGYLSSAGTLIPHDNIEIHLSVTHGSAEVPQGFTDANGHFGSRIDIDSAADSVVVTIFAYGEYNSQADTTVLAFREMKSRIAFITRQNRISKLWTIAPDGSNLHMVADLTDPVREHAVSQFSVSPDGQYFLISGEFYDALAYPHYYSQQIWVVSPSGLRAQKGSDLQEIMWGVNQHPWSPVKPHTFVFEAVTRSNTKPSILFSEEAELAFTGTRDSLGPPAGASSILDLTEGAIRPTYSPDGQWIAFSAGNEVQMNLMACDNTGHALYTVGALGNSYAYLLAWSYDGSRIIAFTAGYQEPMKIDAFPAIGGSPTRVVTFDQSTGVNDLEVFHNADAFIYLTTNGSTESIKSYSFIDNQTRDIIANTGARGFAISPDDDKIVYANENLGGDLFTVDLASGALTQLTSTNVGVFIGLVVWYETQ